MFLHVTQTGIAYFVNKIMRILTIWKIIFNISKYVHYQTNMLFSDSIWPKTRSLANKFWKHLWKILVIFLREVASCPASSVINKQATESTISGPFGWNVRFWKWLSIERKCLQIGQKWLRVENRYSSVGSFPRQSVYSPKGYSGHRREGRN